MIDKYQWNRLNRMQLGKYAEYLAKMEFLLWGCDVYSAEVDDHGIDFVIRTREGIHYDVQVKSFRLETGKSTPYVFLQKSKFLIGPQLLLVLVQFVAGEPPTLWLIPSCVDGLPNPIFVSRDYGPGKKSAPEWGLTRNKRNLTMLCRDCQFETAISALAGPDGSEAIPTLDPSAQS